MRVKQLDQSENQYTHMLVFTAVQVYITTAPRCASSWNTRPTWTEIQMDSWQPRCSGSDGVIILR